MSPLSTQDFYKSLLEIHSKVSENVGEIERISIALYDPTIDVLKTFSESSRSDPGIRFYTANLSDTPSLMKIVKERKPRIVNDMSEFSDNASPHSQIMIKSGFQSSFTYPIFRKDQFFGFIFFNSKHKNYFSDSRVLHLGIFCDLIQLVILGYFQTLGVLRGALETARHFSTFRDEETGAHLERMSRYARRIALELREQFHLDQEAIEHIFRFAPLHDVGKIAIPDEVLLKEGRLNEDEMAIMRTHVSTGAEIIEAMIEQFELSDLPKIEMLKNTILCHHEHWDGQGYPHGLQGEEIPIEARIITVADVFDALTSKRPYKDAWRIDEALDFMKNQSGKQFDPACIQALHRVIPDLLKIKERFKDEYYG